MGFIKRVLGATLLGASATTATFAVMTRNSYFVPLSTADPIFGTTFYRQNNPHTNPAMQDLCVRRVPLTQIRPELLEKEGKLVEAFCAGIWSGKGYDFQRWYLARKYQSPRTSHQLWSPSELLSSSYDVGTQITDHFEVLSKTPEQILVRCGDSPLNTGVRPSDGLFEITAIVKKDEGVAEFGLKSVFYQGLGKAEREGSPMPAYMEFLHRLYTKLWMETAVRNTIG